MTGPAYRKLGCLLLSFLMVAASLSPWVPPATAEVCEVRMQLLQVPCFLTCDQRPEASVWQAVDLHAQESTRTHPADGFSGKPAGFECIEFSDACDCCSENKGETDRSELQRRFPFQFRVAIRIPQPFVFPENPPMVPPGQPAISMRPPSHLKVHSITVLLI